MNGLLGRAPVPVILGVNVVLWGASFNVTDVALGHASAGVVAFSRPLIAAGILLIAMPFAGFSLPRSRNLWLYAAAVGLGSTTITIVGMVIGTEYAGPAVAAVLLNSAPFYAVLMARIALAEKIRLMRALGLFIGFSGVVVIVLSNPISSGSGATLVFGIGAAVIGAIGYAASSVLVRWLSVNDRLSGFWGFTTAQFICGAVFLIPFLLLYGNPGATDWSSGELWASLAFLGIGSQLIAVVLFFVALSRWTSGRVMAWSFLPPVVAAAIEIARGNVPGTLTLIGMAIAIIGVAIVNHPRAEDVPVPSGDMEEHIA